MSAWARKPWVWGALLVVLASAASTIDVPVAHALLTHARPNTIDKLLTFGEAFGHGLGVATLLIAVATLDPLGLRRLPRAMACSYGAGLAANFIKLLVMRTRPHHFDFAEPSAPSVIGYWPGLFTKSYQQSFPSSHTATAFGLAIALASFYPRGRYLFFCLATVVGVQRMASGAHYASDVLTGAAVGCFVGGLFVSQSSFWRIFARLERTNSIAAIHPESHSSRAA